MKLTPHFTLDEMTASNVAKKRGLDNTAPPEILPRLIMLAELLERIRSNVGKPIIVSSGYRSHAVNIAVGGATSSDHTQGHAADIVAPGFGSATELAMRLSTVTAELGIGQLILEGIRGKQWVHVSTHSPEKAINRILTITDSGVHVGILGLG